MYRMVQRKRDRRKKPAFCSDCGGRLNYDPTLGAMHICRWPEDERRVDHAERLVEVARLQAELFLKISEVVP